MKGTTDWLVMKEHNMLCRFYSRENHPAHITMIRISSTKQICREKSGETDAQCSYINLLKEGFLETTASLAEGQGWGCSHFAEQQPSDECEECRGLTQFKAIRVLSHACSCEQGQSEQSLFYREEMGG